MTVVWSCKIFLNMSDTAVHLGFAGKSEFFKSILKGYFLIKITGKGSIIGPIKQHNTARINRFVVTPPSMGITMRVFDYLDFFRKIYC